MDLGVKHDFIDKSGAWYAYKGDKMGQGKANVCKFLDENSSIADEIEALIKEKELGGLMPQNEASEENVGSD